MDVHRLRVLWAVVADGSIQGAAAALGYTPSAISQHITALQKETGLALVRRSGRGIEPTAAGRAVAAEAARIFERMANLESMVADLRAGRVGVLSVSYFASAGAVWIPPVVASLSREFPRLRLDLRLIELLGADSGPPDVEIAVVGAESGSVLSGSGGSGSGSGLGLAGAGGSGLGLAGAGSGSGLAGAGGSGSGSGSDGGAGTGGVEGYRTRPLLTEPYLAVVPATSVLAARPEVDLAELSEEDWVDNDVARGPCRQAVLDACSTVGFHPPFRIETQDYPTAIRFVAEGLGITVIPRLGLGALPASTVAVPIVNPTPRRTIVVRVRDSVADHPAVVRMLALLDDAVASSGSRGR